MKVCNKCKQELSDESFYNRDKKTSRYICKGCYSKQRHEYYLIKKEEINYRNKQWYKNNKEKMTLYHRQHYEENPLKYWASSSLSGHRKLGKIVIITLGELITLAKNTKNCPICGVELKYERNCGNKSNSPTIDRINNEEEMRVDNIWIICRSCNSMKQHLTLQDFINKCGMIYHKFGGVV